MVSRRKILSRSRDDLNIDSTYVEEDEDIWYSQEKLFKEHMQEVLMKWEQIDDEIWAKVVALEKNCRVAKAYARAPMLTINGSDEGFDGMTLGLCGFENPMRDPRTDIVKKHIGLGVKVKMDEAGSILIKRVSRANVFIKSAAAENSISDEILKHPNQALELDKPAQLFDMKKFQANINRELKRAYPDRSKLESQCFSVIAFVKNEPELLDCHSWVVIINIVALDMLKSKLPPIKALPNIKNRPRVPLPDEDPYSVAGSSSGGSTGKDRLANGSKDKPPMLPPRENPHYGYITGKMNGKNTYAEMDAELFRKHRSNRGTAKEADDRKYDDPYYCGLRARVPNHGKNKSKNKPEPVRAYPHPPPPLPGHPAAHHHPGMWPTRSFDTGMALLNHNQVLNSHRLERNPCSWVPPVPMKSDSDYNEAGYSHIYGRLPMRNRGYLPPPPPPARAMYVGDWDRH